MQKTINTMGITLTTDFKKVGIKMKAIIYVRSREQEKKQEQIDQCHKFATDNEIIVAGVYDDFAKVMERVEREEINLVLITDRGRISRNTNDYYAMLVYLLKHKTQLIALDEAPKIRRIHNRNNELK